MVVFQKYEGKDKFEILDIRKVQTKEIRVKIPSK